MGFEMMKRGWGVGGFSLAFEGLEANQNNIPRWLARIWWILSLASRGSSQTKKKINKHTLLAGASLFFQCFFFIRFGGFSLSLSRYPCKTKIGNKIKPKRRRTSLAGAPLFFNVFFFFINTRTGYYMVFKTVAHLVPPRSFDLDTVFSLSQVYRLPPSRLLCSVNIRQKWTHVLSSLPIPPLFSALDCDMPMCTYTKPQVTPFSLPFISLLFLSLLSFNPHPSPAVYLQVQQLHCSLYKICFAYTSHPSYPFNPSIHVAEKVTPLLAVPALQSSKSFALVFSLFNR